MKIFLIFIFVANIIFASEDNNAIGNKSKQQNQYIFRILYGEGYYSTLGDFAMINASQRNHQKDYIAGFQFENFLAQDVLNDSLDFTFFSSVIMHKQDIKKPNHEFSNPKKLSGKDGLQFNAGLKAYWKKFPWSKYVRTRFGIGEGISIVTERLDLEVQNTNKKGRKSDTIFLNYLDFTLSFNLKDLTTIKSFEDIYIGTGLSHRSGIFGTINGVNGGSNYWTFFIEGEF